MRDKDELAYKIIEIVCNYYKVSFKKSRSIPDAWNFYAFFIIRHCGYSNRVTAKLVHKYYSSVSRARDRISFEIEHYESMRNHFEVMEDAILLEKGLVPREETFSQLIEKHIDDPEEKYRWRAQYQTGKKRKT